MNLFFLLLLSPPKKKHISGGQNTAESTVFAYDRRNKRTEFLISWITVHLAGGRKRKSVRPSSRRGGAGYLLAFLLLVFLFPSRVPVLDSVVASGLLSHITWFCRAATPFFPTGVFHRVVVFYERGVPTTGFLSRWKPPPPLFVASWLSKRPVFLWITFLRHHTHTHTHTSSGGHKSRPADRSIFSSSVNLRQATSGEPPHF